MTASSITDDIRALIGRESASYSFDVERGDVARYAASIGDDNGLFRDEVEARHSRFGGLIVPPTYLITMRVLEIEAAPSIRPLSTSVDGGTEWTYLEPIRVGDRLTATQRLADVYERSGSRGLMVFVVTEITYRNQLDQVVAIQRDTAICFGE